MIYAYIIDMIDWYTMKQQESQYYLCSHQTWCKEETRSKVLSSLSFQLHANLPATWYYIYILTGASVSYDTYHKGKCPNHLWSHEIMRASNSLVRHLGGYLGRGDLASAGQAAGVVESISAKGTIRLRRVSLVKTVDVSLAFLCQSGPMPCKLMASTEEPRVKQNAPWQREACLLETLGERRYQIIMSPQYSSGINNGQANHNLC